VGKADSKEAGKLSEGTTIESIEKLTLSQLEQYLSKAAWILKGPVDASDFKVYIFPLLFFKRTFIELTLQVAIFIRCQYHFALALGLFPVALTAVSKL